jgi:deoxyadenosine/deoxycytidine kinase
MLFLYIHFFNINFIFYKIKLIIKNIFKYYSIKLYTMNYQIQIVSIEGNIGSGKSTLLANLKTHFKDNTNIIFLREPVDEWSKITDENGTTILEKFYADQEKYSFSFQMMAYISRLKLLRDSINKIKSVQEKFIKQRNLCMLINCHENDNLLAYIDKIYNEDEKYDDLHKYVIITERSLYTDKMVFAKMLYDSKKIEHVNYEIYLNWFNTFADEFPINKVIYVKTNPEICHKRIGIRHRDGEAGIPIEYLQSCSKYHDNMLDINNNECVCKCQANQLILDGNNDIYENKNILIEWINSIEKFIYN